MRSSLVRSSLVAAALVLLTTLLSGCNDWFNPEKAVFEKYNQRLANVLDTSESELEASPAVTIPDKRELFQELPRLSLGLLESYQLRQCGLFNLLAEKNSQLGKVQDAFYDFDYQTNLLRTLNGCLSDYPLSDEENTKLNGLYDQKWHHLTVHLDNMLLTSDAMRKQLTGSEWLPLESKDQVAHVRDAFLALDEMYQTPYRTLSRLPDVTIVNYQEEIEKTRLVGRLYYTLIDATHWLEQTTHMLEANQDKIICGANRDTTQFRYLRNVFQTIYVAEVQPYMAYVDSTYQQLDGGLSLVEKRMQAHGANYGIEKAHDQFREETMKHVQFWKNLFKRCGVKIGNS
ncbi:hypothetical protein BCT11_23180 [Vibrio sp. 10N.222.52.B12]|uniref:DUF3080 domain-containing protein n=1 Tax=Vibrio sp. 10N.222.52.B12 TaxID=1880840 RepID=UPI000C81B74F|nr:DUF3080 domain-containing protein [Vibrio sp. 10N.222.52.B12]PMO35017.1 hypothetical protein BCT11_23180 [Vibrio sp. 10N.222.52.B12]